MNIALSPAPGIWTPLLGLLRWFTPATPPPSKALRVVSASANVIRPIAIHERRKPLTCVKTPRPMQHRPLRVVRILEADQTPAQVGRMVISGRMADVCAELDRLAACETT